MMLLSIVYVLFCFIAPLLAGNSFTTIAAIDYEVQYMWNNPLAVKYNRSQFSNQWMQGDGMNSYALPNNITMFSYFDSLYGIYDYSNKSAPVRILGDASKGGFSSSSYSKATVVNGKQTSNITNTHGTQTPLDPKVPNNWYWPMDGILTGSKFHFLLSQNYGSKETGNITRWAIIENVNDNPLNWNVSSIVTLSNINGRLWSAFGDDGKSDVIYLFAQNGTNRVLGAVSRCDLAVGRINNVQCWANVSGVPTWTADCSKNLIPIFKRDGDTGSARWNPYLQKWIVAQTWGCILRLYYADYVTGPWKMTPNLWWPEASGMNGTIWCYASNLHPTLTPSSAANTVIASISTWDFNKHYGSNRVYWRQYPSRAPYGDLWIYTPFAFKLNFTITGSYNSSPGPVPVFPSACPGPK